MKRSAFLISLPLLVLGLSAWWHTSHSVQPPVSTTTPVSSPIVPTPHSGTPVPNLLDALAEAAQSGNEEKIARYTQALAALGDEALPEIRKRLGQPKLPAPVLSAYAATLLDAGGEKALPDLFTLWKSPRDTQEGFVLRRPLIYALAQRNSPAFGKALLSLWIEETDLSTRSLLVQALKTNPQGKGPLITQALSQEKDLQRKAALQDLLTEMSSQSRQQEEANALTANPSMDSLKAVLEREGAVNKPLALCLLEKDGSPEAQSSLLAYARKTEDAGLRYQALTSFCRKADAQGVQTVSTWYAGTSKEIQRDILNAIGNSANMLFKPFTESLGPEGKRARDLLVIAEGRRKVGMQP